MFFCTFIILRKSKWNFHYPFRWTYETIIDPFEVTNEEKEYDPVDIEFDENEDLESYYNGS